MATQEEQHALTVRELLESVTDSDTKHRLRCAANLYRQAREHLVKARLSLAGIDDYWLTDEANSLDLRQTIITLANDLRKDEVNMLSLAAEMSSTYAEESIVHNGSDEFASKNDETVSGIDDITLMCQLDGKVH